MSDSDVSGNGIDLEDYGSEIRGGHRLECMFNGCNRTPEYRFYGYIHFAFDGESYSRDSAKVCPAHKTIVDQYVDTATDRDD